jgi:hypothetical protein
LQLQEFIQSVETTRKKLNKVSSLQLHSEPLRNEIRGLIEEYFKIIRPIIIGPDEKDDAVGKIDAHMQTLLELCHKKGRLNTYKKRLSEIRKLFIATDSKMVSSDRIVNILPKHNSIDLQIITTLERVLPSASLSYKQAIQDLSQENRDSWRGPATDLREALRETLDYLAPDKDVQSMQGYSQLKDTNGPTMKQKVRFILMKRGMSKSNSEPAENASEAIESSVGAFVRSVYTRSSVSTHTPTEKKEVMRIRDFVRVVLCELLEIQT